MPQKETIGAFIWDNGNTSINDNIRNLLKERHLYIETHYGDLYIKKANGYYKVHHELIDTETQKYSVFVYKDNGTQIKNVYQIYY